MNAESIVNQQSKVTLREVTAETVRSVCNLKVTPDKNQFVAPVAISIAQAYFEPKAWFRAIYADETPVGFLMLYDDREKNEYFVWRFSIDAQYQKLGFGKEAVMLLIEEVRTRPAATELLVSYVPAPSGPGSFYQNLGFVPTGKMEGIEEVTRFVL